MSSNCKRSNDAHGGDAAGATSKRPRRERERGRDRGETAALRPWHTCNYLASTSALLQGEATTPSACTAPRVAPPTTAPGFKGFSSSASSSGVVAVRPLAALLSLLSEDVLVLICEHLTVADLASFDAVCTYTHTMMTQPPLSAATATGTGADPNADAATPHRYSPIHDDNEASVSASAAAVAAAIASPAHYLWRAAALSPSSWPFPPAIDREHLERTVLTHLRTLPPRSYPSQAASPLGSSMSALQLLLMPPTTQSLQTLDRVMPNFPLPRHALEHTAAQQALQTQQQAQQQAQQQVQQQQQQQQHTAEPASANAVATVAILTPEIGSRPSPSQPTASASASASASSQSASSSSPSPSAEEESFAQAQRSHAMAIALATNQAHEQAMLAQARATQAHALALAQARAHAEAQEAAAQADALAAAQQQQQPLHHHHHHQPQQQFGMAEMDFGSSAAGGSGAPHTTLMQQLHAHAQGHAAQQGYRAARHSLRAAPPVLDWKSILASVGSRRAARGTGTLVLDMGSCTVTVGMGGLDCGPTDGLGSSTAGAVSATDGIPASGLGATSADASSSSGSSSRVAVPVGPLPKSFPAIALNDLVGDQIGSQSVRSINPVDSISMPILHANETGEFGYCSPIWKYAVRQVGREMFMGRPRGRGRGREVRRREQEQDQESVAADASSSSPSSSFSSSAAAAVAATLSSPRAALSASPSASTSASAIPAALSSPPSASDIGSSSNADVGVDGGDSRGGDDDDGSSEDECSEAGSILICDQLLGSRLELAKKRAKVARILFSLWPRSRTRKLKLAFCNESFLSLLRTGKTTGVVLHVGFSRSTCAIFVNSRIQNLHSLPTRMVGGHIHSRIMLQALFSRRQFQPAVADMFAVIPLLKECCYVAADTPEELQKPREETHVDIEITGQRLTLGQERFTSSDVFFLYGFPAMVVEALQSSPAWPVLQKLVQQSAPNAGHHHQSIAAYAPGPATAASMGYAPPHPDSHARSHSQDAHSRTMQASERKEMATQQRGQAHHQSSADRRPVPEPVRSSSPAPRSRSPPRPLSPMLTAQSTTGSVAAMIAAGTALQGERAPNSSASSSPSAATAALVHTAMSMQAAPPPSSSSSSGACDDDGAVVVDMVDTRSPSTSVSSSASSSSSSCAQTHASGGSMGAVSTCSSEDEPHHLIKTLLQNIVLSGRSTSLKGFAQRFERDLNAILKQDTPAKVHENPVECSWLGGSVLCSLSIYPQLCIERDEFEQDGINAVLRHMEI